ncbi:hypothetical protein ACN28E_34795 [Archangium lansingense]|uniref:hypothetical protein n=1 Tax=Archangium lansingense TaxID=2995310 RepID=UPI003B7D02AC
MAKSENNSLSESVEGGKKTKSADEMRPEVREALEKLRELVAQSDAQDADAQYRIGCVVRDVKGSSDKYGKSNVKRLAQELGRDERSLYDRAHVAEMWSPEEFRGLLARKSDKGLPLSFYHLVALSAVEDRQAREQLIAEVLKESYSVKATQRLVKARRAPSVVEDGAGEGSVSSADEGGAEEGKRTAEVPVYLVLSKKVSQLEQMLSERGMVEKALTELKGGATPEVTALVKKVAELQRAVGQACLESAERLDAACGGIVRSSQQLADSGNVSEICPAPSSQVHATQDGV